LYRHKTKAGTIGTHPRILVATSLLLKLR